LKPGMTANVSIIIEHKDDVLQVKNAALRYRPADSTPPPTRTPGASPSGQSPRAPKDGGKIRERRTERTVYVLRGGRPQPIQIKTGISDGVSTEVTEGLKEGDQVVTAELNPAASASASAPPNPFGGGGRRFP